MEALPEAQRKALVASLPPDAAAIALYDWQGIWARDAQLPPDWPWTVWLILAGRGWGKTRTGAEWIQECASSGKAQRINMVAATAADARDVMIEGESGILAIAPPWARPVYQPSMRRLTWPNGAVATVFSADEPDRLRGPQCDHYWADELAAWRYPEAWTQLQLGFRLGTHPQGVVTTTPRPTPVVKDLARREGRDVALTRGTTYENRSNLASTFFDTVIRQYEGTRLGRQELLAEVLEDNPGALWKRQQIDAARVDMAPPLRRVVVAIDPAVSSDPDSDETGIVVAGLGTDGHGYVLDDVSGIFTAAQWAARVREAYRRHRANLVVAEVNNGGNLVEANLMANRQGDTPLPYKAVSASRGKAVRAEPVAALYEQNRVHHVGCLPRLEDQMCGWDPGNDERSPDRVDALVWALTELMVVGAEAPRAKGTTATRESAFDGNEGW